MLGIGPAIYFGRGIISNSEIHYLNKDIYIPLFSFHWISIIVLLITAFSIVLPLYYALKIIDRKPVLLISDIGLDFRQHGFVPWENIWYFYTKKEDERFASRSLHFKLKLDEKQIKISTFLLDASAKEILRQVEKFQPKEYKIYDLGEHID